MCHRGSLILCCKKAPRQNRASISSRQVQIKHASPGSQGPVWRLRKDGDVCSAVCGRDGESPERQGGRGRRSVCVCVSKGKRNPADVMWKDEAATSQNKKMPRLCVGALFRHVYSADIKRQSESWEFIKRKECALSWNTRVTTKIFKPKASETQAAEIIYTSHDAQPHKNDKRKKK